MFFDFVISVWISRSAINYFNSIKVHFWENQECLQERSYENWTRSSWISFSFLFMLAN